MSDRVKKAAKRVRDAAGISYTTALQLIRCDIAFVPSSPNCRIATVLAEVRGTILRGPTPEVPTSQARECECQECDA